MGMIDDIVNGIRHLLGGSMSLDKMTPELVAQKLDSNAKVLGERLDWRHSIVDLMKVLGLDSTLKARRILATELGYTGDVDDNSAEMNMFLHEQVLKKVSEHGISIPTK